MTRHPDSSRSYFLHRYLLGRLAIKRNNDNKVNHKQTARRVGDEGIRKVSPAVFSGEKDDWESAIAKHKKYAKVTTGQLVEMLGALRESLIEEYRSHEESYGRVLTTEDILLGLYQLIELTPEERQRLGLPIGDKLTLLKQTLLSLQIENRAENYEAVFKAYREAVGLGFTDAETAITSLDQVNCLIEKSVRAELSYLPHREPNYRNSKKLNKSSEETIIELCQKAQREVRRLLVRSGNTQAFFKDNTADHPFISNYLQPAFIKKLSQTVVKNERLTAHLPVFLNRLTIATRGPLPFSDTSLSTHKFSSTYPPLLDTDLQELDGSAEHSLSGDIPSPSDYELASQEATKITLGFYIKVPVDYTGVVPETFKKLASDNSEGIHSYQRVDFTYSSTGVGGSLSHIVKIINTTLLSGIPCLEGFFPIAHDVTSTQALILDNVPSPVWAHSLVKLCHRESVGKALQSFQEETSTYDDFSFGDPIGQGDFCGFDFLIAQAQSSLNARLRAIYNTGINPKEYIQQLCEKVERQVALRHAWHTLYYYPFSSMAMIGRIHESILTPALKERSKNLNSGDPKIYFEAYLSIAEALIDEGAYKAAYSNLKQVHILETYARESVAPKGNADVDSENYRVVSSSLLIRYLLCKASYYYLFDLQEWDPTYWHHEFPSGVNSRQQLVPKAWDTLTLAQKHIKARLDKYVVIGEISQGTFNPHYYLLSRIYLLRARLLTFFPRFVPRADDLLPTESYAGQQRTIASVHWGKLFLMEKARLYAAADGDSETYTYYAALQSCYYLTATFEDLEKTQLSDRRTGITRELTRDRCLTWARRLRNHALVTYAQMGRKCYNAVKEKSGLPDDFEDHGRYSIEKLPAIFEDRGLQKGREQSENDQFLTLDISLLALNSEELPKLTSKHPERSLYLFGTNACHIFLARGLYLLCSDTTEEFETNEPKGPIQWERKLLLAGRLFDLAWAIAEDGCKVTRQEGTKQKKITRSFKGSNDSNQYTSREIDSVRDLYPRRISEIADIGKIFSAACMVLRLHLVPADQRTETLQNIDKLFAMLHGEYRLKNNKLSQVLLRRRKRYNGHLENFLSEARKVIERYRPVSGQIHTNDAIESCRNNLMKDLFAALML